MDKNELNNIIKEEVDYLLIKEVYDNVSVTLNGRDFNEVWEVVYTAVNLLQDYVEDAEYKKILKFAEKWDNHFRKLATGK